MTRCEGFEAEEPVIEAIRMNDRFAFAEFMRRHQSWVRGVIFGVLGDPDTVDDVAQQAWMAVWLRIGELRDTKRWRPWLYRLVRNAAIDAGRETTRRRAQMRALQLDSGAIDPAVTGRGRTESGLAVREQRHAVLAAIQSLPPLYREPFVMRHLNEWSYDEIAEAMGMPVDTVETRLVRARRLLRDSLKDRVL